jgi:hypothetical protein
MNKKSILIALAYLCYFNWATSQTIDELSTKYSGYLAAYTKYNETVNIKFKDDGLIAESEEEKELMILDEKAIGLYNKHKVFHSSFCEMKSIEAYTIVPDGSKRGKKIKVTEFKTQDSHSNSVFYDDSKETGFDFPQTVKGAICNSTANMYYKDVHLLPRFYFSSYVPVEQYKFTVSAPENVELKYILKNNEKNIIAVNQYQKGRTNYWEFTAQKCLPTDRLGGSPTSTYYEPHVIIYVASYTKDSEKTSVLSSLDDLYKWNYSFVTKINIEPSTVLKTLADSLTNGIKTDKEKAIKIYQWVQSNIKYVAFEDGLEGFTPRQAADVCTKRYGDCKDMSSLITTLLNIAGIKAYYTWIGTRHIPYKYTDVFLPITDNHMISTANINGNWVFLDGTDPNCIFGFPSSGIQGKQALVGINSTEYKVLDVPVVDASKNVAVDSTFISISENGVKGNTSINYYGYYGSDLWNNLQYKTGDDEKEYVKSRLEKASNKFIMGDYKIKKTNFDTKQINLSASFEIPNYSKKIADEIYINLNLEKFFVGSNIDTQRIKVPLQNEYGYTTKQCTLLDIPDGYEVSYKPKDFKMSNSLFDFDIKYFVNQKKLITTQDIVYKPLLIQATEYPLWNASIQKINSYFKEQIVLKKTTTK